MTEEVVSRERIRQIASEVLQKRTVDSGADHAKPQLDRLAPAVQLGAEAIAAGDISAIPPYLKALDRLDRYQSVAGALQVCDDEARKKLMERINRMAENLGVDEVMWNAAREHLKKIGEIPAGRGDRNAGGPRRGGGMDVGLTCLAQPRRRVAGASFFLIFFARNPLKRLVSLK